MKLLIFNLALLCCFALNTFGQDIEQTTELTTKYKRRVNRYQSSWESLIPTHIKIQYAGGMGFLSLGTGWDYGKHNQWETDLIIGFVPKYSTNRTKLTFTVKQNYMPWNVPLGNKGFFFEPLSCGLYVNTVTGDEFWSTDPDRYPKGYYNVSTKIRFNIYLGERITFRIPEEKRLGAKAITLFYEISTCDLYVVSAVQNSYLGPKDFLKLSLGVKFQLL